MRHQEDGGEETWNRLLETALPRVHWGTLPLEPEKLAHCVLCKHHVCSGTHCGRNHTLGAFRTILREKSRLVKQKSGQSREQRTVRTVGGSKLAANSEQRTLTARPATSSEQRTANSQYSKALQRTHEQNSIRQISRKIDARHEH